MAKAAKTAIKTKDQIKKAMGGVLFIDEAYSLFRGASGNDNDFGREAILDLSSPEREYAELMYPLTQVFDWDRWQDGRFFFF